MKKRKVFIGVAWPYVNGDLHIGHLAGYLLPADISARFHRLIGDDVLMVSGSDCYGTPITVEADKRQTTPSVIVEGYHAKDTDLLLNTLRLSYDLYTKTDTPEHIAVVQEFFLKLLENGYIFTDTTKQYYSPSEARFLPDRYVTGTCPHCHFDQARSDQCDRCGKLIEHGQLIDPKSTLSGEKVELRETQHYFLDWPKLQPELEKYVAAKGGDWRNWVAQETRGWLAEGLKPRAITRDIDWGVPIPTDKIPADQQIDEADHKRFYVWFDAVIGYLSASKVWANQNGRDWRDFWYGDNLKSYYFMGKDNLAFHTLFWPGQLFGFDQEIHRPDVPAVNMFLDLDGQKFSKSRGVIIQTEDFVRQFGNDRARFYLSYIMPETKDSSFSWTDFTDTVNNILVANVGNFVHRSLSLGAGISGSQLADYQASDITEQAIQKAYKTVRESLENCEFRRALDAVLDLASFGNKHINDVTLWQLKKNDPDAFSRELKQVVAIIVALAYLLLPFLPDAAEKLFAMLNIEKPDQWPDDFVAKIISRVDQINLTTTPSPLFEKIEKDLETK